MQKTYAIAVSLVILISLIAISCNHPENEGEKLAKTYCASCHQFPDPSLLDKKTWTENVLPQMAELMNVDIYYNPYSASGSDGDVNGKRVRPNNLFPNEKFKKIWQYYLSTAPTKAIELKDNLATIVIGLKIFKPHLIANKFYNALTTFVQIDTADRKIFFADAGAGKLFSLNQQGNTIDSANVGKGTVAMLHTNNGMQVLSMGILSPSDAKLGKLSLINKNKNNCTMLDSLQRPVFASYADLDSDKKDDIVVSEFGFRQGSLSWYKNLGNGKYEKHLLIEQVLFFHFQS